MLAYTPRASESQRRRETRQYLAGFGAATRTAASCERSALTAYAVPRVYRAGAWLQLGHAVASLGYCPKTPYYRGLRDGLAAGFGF